MKVLQVQSKKTFGYKKIKTERRKKERHPRNRQTKTSKMKGAEVSK